MQVCNQEGIDLIKSFEDCVLTSYQDSGGVWTIGRGHTGPEVVEGLVWTQDQVDETFASDLLNKAEKPLNDLINVHTNDNQFSALCSLCFNIGQGRFAHSGLLVALNGCNYASIPTHIMGWDTIRGVTSAGLVRRRKAEVALWCKESNNDISC